MTPSPDFPYSTRRVIDELAARGHDVEILWSSETTRSAAEAAAALGTSVAQIVKSLVFLVDGRPILALMSGVNRLDEAKLARAVGGTSVKRANADEVRSHTTFVIGGVPPISLNPEMRVVCDAQLTTFSVVYAAAGTPNHNFAVDPDRLVKLAGAEVADLKVD
ncbi:MAG TPA: YbaK/EbsC family protein [Chloroflexota bacterium]|nr:YbaK/EbsC family protein [Chloroflexota bacterium]